MALFKIFSNMGDTSKSLPNTYNQGYCYFDVNTRKFWIDTASDDATAEEKAAGRIAINAPYADIANLAKVSMRIPFGTCTTNINTATKTITDNNNHTLARELLNKSINDTLNAGYPETGTMLMIYFANASSRDTDESHILSLKIPYIGTSEGEAIPIYDNRNQRFVSQFHQVWEPFSLKQFVFMNQPNLQNPIAGYPRWVSISENHFANFTINQAVNDSPIFFRLDPTAGKSNSSSDNIRYFGVLQVNKWSTSTTNANFGYIPFQFVYSTSSHAIENVRYDDPYNILNFLNVYYTENNVNTYIGIKLTTGNALNTFSINVHSYWKPGYNLILDSSRELPSNLQFVTPAAIGINQSILLNNLSNPYGNNTQNTASSFGGSFKVPQLTVNEQGKITAISDTTITLPSSDNVDEKVKQTEVSNNIEYKILATSNTNSTTAGEAVYDSGITLNPNTNTITATNFNGIAAKATAANITTTQNAIAIYNDTAGTFADSGTTLNDLVTKTEFNSLSGPMHFMGTVGTNNSLPTTDIKEGYTYKVINDGTYANIAAKTGDLFVYANNNSWILIPSGDEPTYTLSGALNGNSFVNTLTPSLGTPTTATIPSMQGATSLAAGSAGLVPAPTTNNKSQFLRGDGVWTGLTDFYINQYNTEPIYFQLDGAQINAIKNNLNNDEKLLYPRYFGTLKIYKHSTNLIGYIPFSFYWDGSKIINVNYIDEYNLLTYLTVCYNADGTKIYIKTLHATPYNASDYYAINVFLPLNKTSSFGTGNLVIAGSHAAPTDEAYTEVPAENTNDPSTGIYTNISKILTIGTNSAFTLAPGGSFTIPEITINEQGKITQSATKTITLPNDEKVKQTLLSNSDNKEYKILTTTSDSPNSGTAAEAKYDAGVTINPSTHSLTAIKFIGALQGTATNATNDADGNAISSTYIKNPSNLAAGDLLYWSNSNSSIIPTRLGIGTNGQVLKVTNGVPAWEPETNSVSTLTTPRKIDGIEFNGSADVLHYGYCETAAATAKKIVNIPGFNLVKGTCIYIEFKYTNTAPSPTLNINNTSPNGIKIYDNGIQVIKYGLSNNRIYLLRYNGINYEVVHNSFTDIYGTNSQKEYLYYALDIATNASTNVWIYGSLKVSNYYNRNRPFGIIYFRYYWRSQDNAFKEGHYYDPFNILNSLTLVKDEITTTVDEETVTDIKYYLKIQYKDTEGWNSTWAYVYSNVTTGTNNILYAIQDANGNTGTDTQIELGEGHNVLSSCSAIKVNSANDISNISFTDHADGVQLSLSRAGYNTTALTGIIPKVSNLHAGVVPKGETVSSQNQDTRFLREDGTWAAPSYTENTDTDTLVNQTALSNAFGNNKEYKILTTASNSPDSGSAAEAAYDNSITINPYNHTITATKFIGSIDPIRSGFAFGSCTNVTSFNGDPKVGIVSINNFTLQKGSYVTIAFSGNVEVQADTKLNINNTGNIPITYKGSPIGANVIKSGDLVTFIYTGTNYEMVFERDTVQQKSGDNANNLLNTGIYYIASGASNTANLPKGYTDGNLITLGYNSHKGRITTNHAAQIYLYSADNDADGVSSPGNNLYYRTSSLTEWYNWQKVIHTDAITEAIGSDIQPVYIDATGKPAVTNIQISQTLSNSQAVVTNASGVITTADLTVSDSTTDPDLSYVYKVTQTATGKITATKATIRSASISQTGVVSLSNATNSTAENVAATSKAVNTVYDLVNTANTAINNHKYWASLESTSDATYNSTPEVASVKYGNGTTATAAKSFTIQFNETDESLDFIYVG